MNFKHTKLFMPTFLIILLSQYVFADYGEKFLSYRCDVENGYMEIEPLIIWNEDLDAIEPLLKKANRRITRNGYKLFSRESIKSDLELSCPLKNASLKVIYSDSSKELHFYENGKSVLRLEIGFVWEVYSEVFKISYDTSEWKEICYKSEEKGVWKKLDLSRKNTECSNFN